MAKSAVDIKRTKSNCEEKNMTNAKKDTLQYILEKDVILTKKFIAQLLQFASFRSLRAHCKFLEISADGIVWLAVWIAFIWIANSESLYEMQFNMILGLLIDILVVAVIKATVRRRRPIPPNSMLTIGPDKFSFPSGHASRAFLVLMFFTNLYPVSVLFWMPLIAWACSVSLSRLILERHYLLDVTAGACLGVFEAMILNLIWISPNVARFIINYVSEDNLPGGTE